VALSPQFLDELRARTDLVALIGRSLKLERAGREHKACCPFHQEQTPSFTIVEEKGFYHCFGCGAHGDAIRWLTDAGGLSFIDAVKQLAADAGMEVPAPSPEAAAHERNAIDMADVLAKAASWYREQLGEANKAKAALEARGLSPGTIERFEIGFAPAGRTVSSCGVAPELLEAAGLLIKGSGRMEGLWLDRFRGRIMIPIRDPRGRMAGFAGRIVGDGEPKYLNNPDSRHFDKGRILFNLHRAAPAARAARRLIIVEGQFDAIALDQAGIAETVAPGGTALTEHQLERAWRVAHCPILLMDGDAAGRKAALRACERALPLVGPGKALKVALLPAGEDPDSLARSGGAEAIEAAIGAAMPMAEWLWQTADAAADHASPEGRAALWERLKRMAGAVTDRETRDQYRGEWRRRFDARHPPLPPGLTDDDILPDGEVADLSECGEGERATLATVAAAWLERERDSVVRRLGWSSAGAAAKMAGRSAWEIGRRAGADLVAAENAADAIEAMAAARGSLDIEQLRRSLWIGGRRGASLLAAMRLDRRCSLYERTDMGNAERWHARHGEDYLYTTAKGWLGWDRRRYRVLNQEKDVTPAEVQASVFDMVRAIQREADFIRDSGWPEDEEIKPDLLDKLEADPRKPGGLNRLIGEGSKAMRRADKLRAWGRASEASGRLGCVPGLVKRWVTVELTEFDTDPMLLNCQNGTLRFMRADESGPARVELHKHRREDRLTKVTACDYDQDAPAPIFQKTVRWAQPGRDRRRYLRQWLGYNLTGDMGEQIFHIWYGPLAANGKSTVGNACREAIGDYGDTTNVETFLDEGPRKHGDQATPAIVRLPGVRFLTAGEPPKGAKINEPLINSVTGGDPMLARDNFRSFFRFLPIFKFTLWCNDLPAIPQGTAGIWRRVKVIPWEQHLEKHERDQDLPKKLRDEYAGILAWMVRGLIDWMDNGFVEPESVQLASDEYKQDSDPLSSFLRLCTVPDPSGRVQSSHLYALFCAWAKAAGETEWKQKGFSQALKAKGLASKASNGMHWLGIKAVREVSDFVDGEGRVKNLGADLDGEGAPDRGDRAPPPASAGFGADDDDVP
jgi:DNA primase